ncbi:bacteriophage baseplate assembly protein W [Salinicola rhizosphaerae]|uniref:Bacteriophage baseplate assembly protein W n=2 Tax=Salinicola rhizosphaerae TaxID=1443141 RepID=A0ABQ3EBX1_9GAMM|nr:bacteriophage baseplate assembly protein W [Salinicola rhizosphaerae]
MPGMNRTNGAALDGFEHIRQSVADILTTPIGSRVMRREYGSLIPDLIDQPLNDALMLRVYSAAVMAIIRWEPRLRVTGVRQTVDVESPGRVAVEIRGVTEDEDDVALALPLNGGDA